MQTKRKLVGALLLLLAIPARAEKVHPKAGSSSASFLKLGVGARPIGMGEAFTAVADDAHSVYWNPAGLAGLSSPRLSVMHHESFEGIRHEFLGYVFPGRNGAAWGFGFISLFVPNDLERRSGGALEADPFNPITNPEGHFGAYDLAASLSYARPLDERQSFGATVKMIRQSIDNESAQTGAVDLGWKMKEVAPRLNLAAVVQNLGPGVKFGTSYALPMTAKVGAAYLLPGRRFGAALDISVPRDDYPTFALGGDYKVAQFLSLRAGYRLRSAGNPLGAFSGFRTGVGFNYQNVSLDYAFAPFGDLGNTHRVSLGWKFGNIEVAKASAPASTAVAGAPEGTVQTAAITAPVPAPSPPPMPKPVVPLPAVPAAAPAAGEYTPFQVWARPKLVSARGTDYLVTASAPAGAWKIKKIEFRSMQSTTEPLAVGVLEAALPKPLPGGATPVQTYRIRLSAPVPTRSTVFDLEPVDGRVEIWAWSEGQWKPLKHESITEDGHTALRARCDSVPELITVGVFAFQSADPGR